MSGEHCPEPTGGARQDVVLMSRVRISSLPPMERAGQEPWLPLWPGPLYSRCPVLGAGMVDDLG